MFEGNSGSFGGKFLEISGDWGEVLGNGNFSGKSWQDNISWDAPGSREFLLEKAVAFHPALTKDKGKGGGVVIEKCLRRLGC